MEQIRYVKICPNKKCTSRINDAQELECAECGHDLVMVSIVEYTEELRKQVESGNYPPKEEKQPVAEEIQANAVPQAEIKLIKICESCGHENLPQLESCEECGDYIGDILPVNKDNVSPQQKAESSSVCYQLISLDGSFVYTIEKDWLIIGRSHECKSFLSGKLYVSREHAVLSVADNKLYIEDRNTTNRNYTGGVNNHTFVNGVALNKDEKRQLNENDIIGLGDRNTEEVNAGFLRVGIKK